MGRVAANSWAEQSRAGGLVRRMGHELALSPG